MKTKLILILTLLAGNIFAQELDTTAVNNSLKNEKNQGIFKSDLNFYGVEMGDNNDDYIIRFKNYKRKRSTKRSYGTFDIDYGFNYLQVANDNIDPNIENPDFNFWLSTYFGFSFNGKTRIFSNKSPLFIKYGLGLQWHNYTVKGNYILEKTANGVEYVQFQNGSLNSSSIKNLYMTMPLMLQLDFSKYGADNGVKLGVGAYGGVRFNTWQKLEYKDADGDKTKVKTRNKMHYNPFNYGLEAELGYGSFSLNARYDLSSLHDVDNPYDYNVWRFGIKFAL